MIGSRWNTSFLLSSPPLIRSSDRPGEFQAFATSHPEYAKLFTTYLELQRYQAIQEAMPGDLELADPGEKQEDGSSDKKDD